MILTDLLMSAVLLTAVLLMTAGSLVHCSPTVGNLPLWSDHDPFSWTDCCECIYFCIMVFMYVDIHYKTTAPPDSNWITNKSSIWIHPVPLKINRGWKFSLSFELS